MVGVLYIVCVILSYSNQKIINILTFGNFGNCYQLQLPIWLVLLAIGYRKVN